MKVTEAKLLDFLKKSPQFIIPIYQRNYSWAERECLQLWEDIIRTGKNDKVSAHFVGSIVYIEKGLYQVSSQTPLLVIDGQERLTAITLLLEALARHLGDSEPIDGFSAKKIRNYYLLNPLEDGERGFIVKRQAVGIDAVHGWQGLRISSLPLWVAEWPAPAGGLLCF